MISCIEEEEKKKRKKKRLAIKWCLDRTCLGTVRRVKAAYS
jgi:hypothetical protein